MYSAHGYNIYIYMLPKSHFIQFYADDNNTIVAGSLIIVNDAK